MFNMFTGCPRRPAGNRSTACTRLPALESWPTVTDVYSSCSVSGFGNTSVTLPATSPLASGNALTSMPLRKARYSRIHVHHASIHLHGNTARQSSTRCVSTRRSSSRSGMMIGLRSKHAEQGQLVLQQLLELPIIVPNEPKPRRLAELNPEGLTAGRGIQSVASPTAIAAVGPEVEADAPN